MEFAGTQDNLGGALVELGDRGSGTALNEALEASARAYRAALEVFTPERTEYEYRVTQRNLAQVLDTLRQRGAAGA